MMMGAHVTVDADMTAAATRRPAPLDMSLDAAIELEGLLQGKRSSSPTFEHLISLLKEPRASALSPERSVNMLADVRSFSSIKAAYRKTTQSATVDSQELRKIISKFLDELLEGVRVSDKDRVTHAKNFCLKLNHEFLATDREKLSHRHTSRSPLRDINVDRKLG